MKKTKRILLGAAAALAGYLALLALLSLLIVRGSIAETAAGACTWLFACLAAFAGAMTAARKKDAPLADAAACAAAFWGTVLLFGFTAYDGLDTARAAGLAIPIFLGAAIACLLKRGEKRGRKKHARRARR